MKKYLLVIQAWTGLFWFYGLRNILKTSNILPCVHQRTYRTFHDISVVYLFIKKYAYFQRTIFTSCFFLKMLRFLLIVKRCMQYSTLYMQYVIIMNFLTLSMSCILLNNVDQKTDKQTTYFQKSKKVANFNPRNRVYCNFLNKVISQFLTWFK